MHRSLCLIVFALAVAVSTFAATPYTKDGWKAAYTEAGPDTDILALFRDWAEHAEDVDVLRAVQTEWRDVDSAGCEEFFKARYAQNPQSAKWTYLAGRFAETPEQLALGRRAIELDPQFPYGYRLVAVTYAPLFDGVAAPAKREFLTAELPKDEAAIARWLEAEPNDPNAVTTNLSRLIYLRDLPQARMLLERAVRDSINLGSRNKVLEYRASIAAAEGKYAEAKACGDSLAASLLEHDAIDSSEIADYAASVYVPALRRAGAYDELLKAMGAGRGDLDAEELYNLACEAARFGHSDAAFDYLNRAVAAGYAEADWMQRDADLEPLRTEAAWGELVARARQQETAAAEKFAAELATHKVDKEAPDWTLTGPNGETVKLSDLRGQVVILDFWATWCGPCRMAMPVIDNFVKTQKPEGVRVFSVNVRERAPRQKPRLFMQQRGYAMELLYGTDDVYKAYGIQGIPYLCAIDKQGRIRYEELGYSSNLKTALPLWVKDLLHAQ